MSVSHVAVPLLLKRPYNRCVSPKCNYLYTARYRFSIKINDINLEFDGKISLYLTSSINFWKILHNERNQIELETFLKKVIFISCPLLIHKYCISAFHFLAIPQENDINSLIWVQPLMDSHVTLKFRGYHLYFRSVAPRT